MTKQVQLRRGTTAEHAVFTGAEGELTVDTTLDIAVVHDGVTVGGRPLVGAAATQQIINKTGVGIGTSSLSVEFQLVGNANIAGQINARGLTVRYQSPFARTGIISATSNNKITGIATNGIRVGYSVTSSYIAAGSTVTSVGIETVFLSLNTSSLTGLSTGKFLVSEGNILIGVNTIGAGVSVGYAVSATGVLNDTTVSGISSLNGGTVTLSQNSSGTLGITTRTGNVVGLGSTVITGIVTASLNVGDQIFNPDIYDGGMTTITSIGASTLTVGVGIGTSGTPSFTISRIVNLVFVNTNIGLSTVLFNDPEIGQINVDVTNINKADIASLTVGSQSVTNSSLLNSTVTNQIVTNQNVETQYVNNLYASTGILTSSTITNLQANSLTFNVGVGTTLTTSNLISNNAGISTAYITSSFVSVGINTSFTSTYLNIPSTGIATINSLNSTHLNIPASGIATIANINFASGVGTNLYVGLTTIQQLYATGVIVSGMSTIDNISGVTTYNGENINLTNRIEISDQLSYTYQGTLSAAGFSTITGISTAGLISGFTVSGENIPANAYIVGIGVSSITLNTSATNSGVSTANFTFTDGRTGINTIPIIKGKNLNYSGISTLSQAIITSGNISSITASSLDMSSGIATVGTLNVATGIITTLTATTISASNVTVGIGSTNLIVDGDARITGVLTVGQGSVTVNGITSSIYGISTVFATSGIITTLIGTGVSYTNVSVGSTLSFVGVNTFNSLDKTVQFRLSNSGVATNYTLTLPPNRGRDGMSLTVDATGNLGFSTNPGGLYENRIYVSSANGNDADDGKTKPVQSIKRAAQLASFESFVLPDSRFIDAANRLEANRTFIMDQVVGFVTFAYPGITTSPGWDRAICARDVGLIVDAVAYDLTYNGNSQSRAAGLSYIVGVGTTTYVDGEKTETIAGIKHIFEMSKFLINNVAITTSNLNLYPIGIAQTSFQSFDNTILYDQACNPSGYSTACCANVQSSIVNLVGIVTSIIGVGTTAAPALVNPTTKSNPVAIIVEAGEYIENNPIILYEDVAVLGDNLRNTIIRPLNAGKDLFRVRNGIYLTGFAMKDYADAAGVPQYTFDFAVAFDDPSDSTTSRTGYAVKNSKPFITRSPYIQNCSILSFLGASGVKVDGSKVLSPNIPVVPQESEVNADLVQPQQGKSMVAAAFTIVSFGGVGWRVFNDGYSQVVSCFQIFCKYGSLAQSGGYLSITNSATNFGQYALRSTGFSKNSFAFDRGRIAATGTAGGLATLKVVGLGRSDQDLYVVRFFDDLLVDRTIDFKPLAVNKEINGATDVNIANDQITATSHPFINGDSVVYFGDDQSVPPRIIGGLVPDNQYWIGYINANTFKLYEDEGLTTLVNLTAVSTGIHTFQKNSQEFFAKEVINAHNSYQKLGIGTTSSTLKFISGKQITQTVVGGTAVGIAYTFSYAPNLLFVSVEESGGVRRNFQITNGSTNLNILDHNNTPISIAVTSVAGVTTYWTTNFKVDSTVAGTPITGIATLPENFKLHFHRPSTVNSSSHTWEYSGAGIDYNALPENGGKSDPNSEQVSELGGRVFTSGTNELGDFKIGSFITAFNRTGNIVFNNTVTIGTLDSIRLSLSGGTPISEFSSDIGLGDNETGGPKNERVSTQLAVRSFLSNRLGSFIDKNVSANAVPGAVVQLNSIGQINADLIPPKVTNYFKTTSIGGRTQLVNFIPAIDLRSGDTVVEPEDAYVLINDVVGQFIILSNSTVYNFENGDIVTGAVSQGGAVGVVTAPTTSGINTDVLSFPNVGYGTTGLVRGVPLGLKELSGGSGYNSAGIYTGVRLDTSSGIGTGITATITVSAAGTVSNVAINTGGFKFASNDVLTLNDPTPIGGRTGGANFTVKINSVETRLYLKLTNNQKFQGSVTLPDYIQDRNAVSISTNVGIALTHTFTPTDIGVGGDIDFVNDRVAIAATGFGNGDPVVYSSQNGTALDELQDHTTYYVKRVGISSIELYTTYALSTKVNFTASGTGTHKLTRPGINTTTDQITFVNHGLSAGDAVRVAIGSTGTTLPTGITTNAFYFVGSATTNTFTLHLTRTDSLLSANGLLYNAEDIITTGSGIVSFTKQNISYSSAVNTSSNDSTNWTLLASNDIDAANIISGTVSPSRLGSGSANSQTFLRGDSSFQKVITAIGIGTTQPFDIQGYTSADFPAGGVGFTTYYGILKLGLNRVQSSADAFSTLGISKFKLSTFSIGADGAISLKNAAGGGDIDAVTLSGNNAAYFLNVDNHTGNISIARGGTGLSALPSNGAFLVGNGSSYNLTTTPTFIGDATFSGGAGAVTLSANSDITFTNSGSWSGDTNGKIQYFNNSLYLTYATSLILRVGANDRVTFSSAGGITASSTISGTTLTSTIGTGTAPLTVSSTTQVSNLNVSFLEGYSTATANTVNTIVRRDGSGNFSAGTITAANYLVTTASSTEGSGVAIQRVFSKTVAPGQLFRLAEFEDVEGDIALEIQVSSEIGSHSGTSLYRWQGGYSILPGSYYRLYPSNDGSGHGDGPDTGLNSNAWNLFIYGTTVSGSAYRYGVAIHVPSGRSGKVLVTTISELKRGMTFTDQSGTAVVTSFTNSGNIYSYTNLLVGSRIGIAKVPTVALDVSGAIASNNTITGTTLTSTIGSGTAPLTVSSTTQVNNLNAQYLNGLLSTSANTASTIVARDGSGNFNAGTITATTFSGNHSGGSFSGTSVSGTTGTFTGNVTVSTGNANGGGIIFADDGDIVDLNDGYCSMRMSSGVRIFSANRGGSAVITLGSNGTVTATSLVETSSLILKENINPISGALDTILGLNPVTYDRKDGSRTNESGLIAEEVAKIIPSVVTSDENGNPNSIMYSRLTTYLIQAIKELKSEIDNLKLNK